MSPFSLSSLFGSRAPESGGPVVALVLYTKPACSLCDAMKRELARARVSRPFELTEVDIESDPELLDRFGLCVPVLEIAGRVVFEGRLSAAEFERVFERLATGAKPT